VLSTSEWAIIRLPTIPIIKLVSLKASNPNSQTDFDNATDSTQDVQLTVDEHSAAIKMCKGRLLQDITEYLKMDSNVKVGHD